MSLEPQLSVIIPTHDRAGRLRKAIESVRSQTLADLEVIVVDDASSDETSALVDAAAASDERIRALRLAHPSGAPAARNAGIQASRGDFIAFLDDDDEWLPGKSRAQIELLRKNPDVVAVSCHHEVVREGQDGRVAYRGPIRYSRRAVLWSNFGGSCSFMMIRRGAFPEPTLRELFDERLQGAQDWDTWIRCAGFGGLATVPEVLCRYIFHSDAQISSRPKQPAARAALVAKYAGEMSEACRIYHEARIRLIAANSQRERLRLHAEYLMTLPRGVRRIVALESLAARVGELTGDPARGHRTLLRLLERIR
jgi:glycosyltransferase involved in cell wall biosynthesis